MLSPISVTKEAQLKVLTSAKGQSVQMVRLSLLYKGSMFQLSSGEQAELEPGSAHDS